MLKLLLLSFCLSWAESGPMNKEESEYGSNKDPIEILGPLLHPGVTTDTEQPLPLQKNISCTCICGEINSPCLCISFDTNTVHNVKCTQEFDIVLVDSSSGYSEKNESNVKDLQDLILQHPDLQYFNTNLLSDGIFTFASDFLKNYFSLSRERLGENFVFSPLSIHAVLSILTSAATPNSQTQIELLNSLGSLNNINSLETLYKMLFEDYSEMTEMLRIANGMWSPTSLKVDVNSSFIKHAYDIYKSSYQFVDAEFAKNDINVWVNSMTDGKIKSLFDRVASDFMLILANVMYFKGSWTIEFEEPNNQQDNYFTLENGRRVQATMMERESIEFKSGIFDFGRVKNIKAVTIPYEGSDSRFEMVLVVPQDHKGLSHIQYELLLSGDIAEENLFQLALSSIEADYEYSFESPTVLMPEFLLKTKLNINEVLKTMGVTTIFYSASLDKIGEDLPLTVSQIEHKAILEVNKQGTEGAAATGIELVPLIGGLEAPTSIRANVPFMFFIFDTKRHIPLFMGQVTDPRV